MPRTTRAQKLDRVLRFLVGLRDPALRGPLLEAGFTDRDLDEGWSLLRRTSPPSVQGLGADRAAMVRNAIRTLEAWARRYIKLIEGALSRRHPEVHHFLYAGIDSLTGTRVVPAVQRFLDRVQELPKRKGGAEARALLEARGLTEAARAEARAAIAAARAKITKDSPDYGGAEDAAWNWYLEWKRVAAQVVADGRVKNRLALDDDES